MYDKVNWPDRYHPGISPLYALNDIDVRAPVEAVWKLVVEAENWAGYFPAEDSIVITGGESELVLGSTFTRNTVGHPMTCTVQEYEPFRRIAWSTTVDDDMTHSTAYHGWVVTPTATGCHLLTEETQQGAFFLDLLGRQLPGGIYAYHQDWIERLATAAEADAAAPTA